MALFFWLKELYRRFHNQAPSLVSVLIFKQHILHNFAAFQGLAPTLKLAPVLKSNAYGHGLIEVGRILETTPSAFLVVDAPFEARLLRRAGIRKKILIIGFTPVAAMQQWRLSRVSFTVGNLEHLQAICRALYTPQSFHLKIDTGMHRQGLSLNQLTQAITLIKNQPLFRLEGICSHLAAPYPEHHPLTQAQLKRWHEVVTIFKKEFPDLPYFHLSASGGLFLNSSIYATVGRLGLGLYGIAPNPLLRERLNLQPALEMQTSIIDIRTVPAGEGIGYEWTATADRPLTIATLPVGYFEGLDLRLSNRGVVLIKGIPCPIIGRVSMNLTTVEISAVPGIKIGDQATVISARPAAPNSIAALADFIHTIPYEVLVRLPSHLRRTVVA